MAFAVRAHNHLWGKNNEDPLAFLYRQGLSLDFSRQMYLGWNKFKQERPYTNWGMEHPGSFSIPPGLVFPYIVEKELKSLFIVSMDNPKEFFMVPGGVEKVLLGNPENETRHFNNLLEGLKAFQENQDNLSVRLSIYSQ